MIKNSDFHILFASRLVIEKGVDILIESIEKSMSLSDFPKNIVWDIVSDGAYTHTIEALEEKYPSQVHYHGKVSAYTLAEFYRKSDLLFMPSRFLETFGLTALEALSCGIPVCGFRKGGLLSFIAPSYALDPGNPVDSFFDIIQKLACDDEKSQNLELSDYKQSLWAQKIEARISSEKSVCVIHDYSERIGGAEYYVESIMAFFEKSGNPVARFSYRGKTSPWRRRWMFMISLFAFWRGISLRALLIREKPEIIWMHSILRYVGYWGVRAATLYARETGAKILLSHHDVGLIAPFPQDITEESQIPKSPSAHDFLRGLPPLKKIVAFGKWFYVRCIRHTLPQDTEHIVFASFLEKHIKNHFPIHTIHHIPHSVDETIFHP